MPIYKIHRPRIDELQRWAASLVGLPPGHPDRLQAARAALPAAWRTRDRVKAPEWPPLDDLNLWADIGASHALQLIKPPTSFALIPVGGQPEPYVLAYSTAYLTTLEGHFMPDQHQQLSIVEASANELDLGNKTLEVYMTGDASELDPEYRAGVLVALHKMFGLNPLSKAWIIVDGKIYPTAAAASAVRRRHGLECDVLETTTVEIGGVQLIKCVAECRDPSSGRSERSTAFVSWLVERVTDWGTSAGGKRFPKTKVWEEPNPEQVADKMMKAQTKAMRRVTLLFAALGSSAAEDVPGSRDFAVEQIEQLKPIEPPHSDEAGR